MTEDQLETISNFCSDQVGKVRYASRPREQCAEENCVSAIYKVFLKICIPFPYDWVGSLPGRLQREYKFQLIPTCSSRLRTGDLIFLRNPKVVRKISHVAMILGKSVYHCTLSRGGIVIEELSDLLQGRYEQGIRCPRELLEYRDPRARTHPHSETQELCDL